MIDRPDKSLFKPVPEPPRGIWSIFKRRFTRGLAALLPTLLTIAILLWAYDLVNRTIGHPINRGLVVLVAASGTPGEGGPLFKLLEVDGVQDALKYGEKIGQVNESGQQQTIEALALAKPEPRPGTEAYKTYVKERRQVLWRIAFRKYWLDLVGFAVAVVICYFVGLFLASFIGHSVWGTVESFFKRLPIVKAIYPHIKQVTDFLFSESNLEFGGVVAVEYPRKGIWSVGLKTGGPMKTIVGKVHEDLVTVFVPSSPTPFTGYVIQVPRRDVIDLSISIDQALRFAVSGGVIKPESEMLPGAEDFQAKPLPHPDPNSRTPMPATSEQTP